MSAHRLLSIAGASLCVSVAISVLPLAVASAHLTNPYLCQITGRATPSSSECNLVGNTVPGGSFQNPEGVAVDGNGHIYVSDATNGVVDVFDSTGNFIQQLTGTSPSDPFLEPRGITIDGSKDLWVADAPAGLFDRFDASGDFLGQATGEGHWNSSQIASLAFSEADDHLYAADSQQDDLWVLNADGTYNSDIKGPWGSGCCYIAVAADDSSGATRGDLYVSANGNRSAENAVFRIDGTGVSAPFSASASYVSGAKLTGTPEGPFGRPTGIAVDSAGDLYVLDSGKDVVDEFEASGLFLAQISGLSTPSGSIESGSSTSQIAVSAAGDVYVPAAAIASSAAAVDVFGPRAALAGVALEDATNVQAGAATLNGTVDPENGGAVTCQFLWGTTEAYGQTAPCTESVPDGNAPAAVQAQLNGLAANTTYHYRLSATNPNGTEYSRVATFTTPGPPQIDAESAEVLAGSITGQTQATLKARITPEGRETTYRFEYGETTSYGTSVPSTPEAIGSGESPVSVPAGELTGLRPGVTYHYRVVASNEYGTVDGADQTFTTVPTLLIDSQSATDVTADSATIEAQLNPLGVDTLYHFEYGTSASYGTVAPMPDRDAGAGEADVRVALHLQGLQPGTNYHYRVVVSSEPNGTPVTLDGLDHTFTTQSSASEVGLPDGRQWEMVTPPNKQGSGIYPPGFEQGDVVQAAADGDGITFAANGPFTANPAGSRSLELTQVISSREAPDSWATADIATAHDENSPPSPVIGQASEYKLFSSDLSLGLVEPAGDTPLSPQAPSLEQNVYLREPDGAYQPVVTAANIPPGTQFGGHVRIVSASPDLHHVVLQSSAPLVSGAPVEPAQLYEWTEGRLQLVSVLPDGRPLARYPGEGRNPVVALGDYGGEETGVSRDAISEDGSRIVWEGEGRKGLHYYLRDMAKGETVAIDAAQEGQAETTTGSELYRTASGTDSRVFFSSSRRLTADATAGPEEDLYVYEVTSAVGQPLAGRLTDLTPDSGPADTAAGLVQVIGASADGSYIYFLARGVIGDGAAHGAEANGYNLYLAQYDEASKAWSPAKFIAALSAQDSPSWGNGNDRSLMEMTSRVSPDGHYLAFMSDRSLTGYDNLDANSGAPDEEVFLYDAGDDKLICASCNPTGARPVGLFDGERGEYDERLVNFTVGDWEDRWLAANVPAWNPKDIGSALYQTRYLSDSGRLYFDSNDALVPSDVNGKEDVYEYEPVGVGGCQPPSYGQSGSVVFSTAVGGCVALISAGTSSEESAFMDASETGDDVFFLTESQLSPRDTDTSFDIYDAHECSAAAPCAPPQALTPPPCSTGDACKPAPTPQPTLFGTPSSETFSGAGNIAPAVQTATRKATPRLAGRAQKLANALKACHRKARRKRGACERKAKRRYPVKRSVRAGAHPSTTTGR
ncbi:MAG TPA: hypothetical protein VMU32_12575 [Solirubrobacteraceae bacterium]|nr:hypothetical protein [Solirubrobacteraceae bacterium]